MKLKVVVIDLEIPAAIKRRLLRIGLPTLILGAAAMAYATPAHVWSNGDTLTAEHLNAAFADLDTRLAAVEGRVGSLEAASPGKSAFLATRSTPQEIPQGADTALVFDTEYFDVANEYNPATGVFTPKTGGYYEIGCSWESNVTAAGTLSFFGEAGIKIGETPYYSGWYGDGYNAARTARTLAQINAGTPVVCLAYQESGMTLSTIPQLDTKFEAIRLSP